MHFLVEIHNNMAEWREALAHGKSKPHLPLPYSFGAALLSRGHKLSAVDTSQISLAEGNPYPFETIYSARDMSRAMRHVDAVTLWGGLAISAAFKQFFILPIEKKVILNTYVWQLDKLCTLKSKKLGYATRIAAFIAKALVVMTGEQAEMARKTLPKNIPVINFRYGIDTAFYRGISSLDDVPKDYQPRLSQLLAEPYVIMPGDQLRLNQDALDIVTNSSLRLVRIPQCINDQQRILLRNEIKRRGIENRFFVFEKVNYAFLRFLLQHADAYAGLVDSTWQPAGWTVACEALASGLPVVLYEGLVSRELKKIGGGDFLKTIPMRDIKSFQKALESFKNKSNRIMASRAQMRFSADQLDLEITASDFAMNLESIFK